MCCLFGLLDFKHALSPTEKSRVLSILGTYCEARGVDATGYLYNHKGKLTIRKEAVPAHKMPFDIPTDANLIMGHTRMTTQGSASHAKNNHPFLGRLPHNRFALAHNGILTNDQMLRKSERLPKAEIETDSYIAVQLIEKYKTLDFHSLRNMAEAVKGTFTFTVMDNKNRLYIIKGNNPLCLYCFDDGFYLYASTKAILEKALETMGYQELPHSEIAIADGEILRITPDGSRKSAFFKAPPSAISYYAPYCYDDPFEYWYDTEPVEAEGYRKFLLDYAKAFGIPENQIQYLHQYGLPDSDLEECIYDPSYRRICLLESGYYDEMEEMNYYDRCKAVPW